MPLVAMAAIGGATSLIGGGIASHGATNAANTQAAAAYQGAQLQHQDAQSALDFQKLIYGNQQQQLSPYLSIGAGASANLANLLGVLPKDAMFYPTGASSTSGTATGPNPNQAQADKFGNEAAYLQAVLAGKNPAGANGQHDWASAPHNSGTIAKFQQQILQDQLQRDRLLNSGQNVGLSNTNQQGVNLSTLINPALGSTGDLMKPFEWKGPDDPAFQFRMQEGQKALERSAAAKGGLLSGGTAKAIDQYSQDLASTEYSNSFDRYRASQSDRFNRLASLAGYGPQAVSQSNTSGTNAANNIASILMTSGNQIGNSLNNAGAARASGYAGNANIWGSTLSNLGNLGSTVALLKYLNPGGVAWPGAPGSGDGGR